MNSRRRKLQLLLIRRNRRIDEQLGVGQRQPLVPALSAGNVEREDARVPIFVGGKEVPVAGVADEIGRESGALAPRERAFRI